MPKKTAEKTSAAIINQLQSLPFYAQQTLTMDNGAENAKHEDISKSLGTKCYFAHPYHSWQRGTNENTNDLIRWYLPEGTDFSKLLDEQIMYIESNFKPSPKKVSGV